MDKPKKANKKLQRERELQGWSQAKLAEKIGTTVKRVSMWECGDTAPGRYYQEALIQLFGKNAQELGFLDDEDLGESEASQQHISHTDAALAQETNAPQLAIPNTSPIPQSVQLVIPNGVPVSITVQAREQILVSSSDDSGTFVSVDEQPHTGAYSSYEDVDISTARAGSEPLKRRDFFRETGRAAIVGAAYLASHDMLSNELLVRFHRALQKPATIDERFLNYIQLHTENYWRDHYHASLASYDLLSYVEEHFQKIVHLLEGPLLPTIRTRICSIASGTALLIGVLYFDMAYYSRSKSYFKAAIRASQDAGQHTLQAVAWGWMSLAWTYGNEDLQEASACIQTARQLALLSNSITVRTWLAAMDAEAQAKLGNDNACRKALDEAEQVEDSEKSEQVHYWTSYDKVQFDGYKGTCLRLLHKPEDKQTNNYLVDAQEALKEALTYSDPVIVRLQSVFLSDLASTFIQQREVEEACKFARQALATNAPQSRMVVQRVLKLRQEMNQWRNLQDVKELDAHLASLTLSSRLN